MPAQPEGERPPDDGALPDAARQAWGVRPFGVYVHVPFCSTRCGYCDFNTYTATELVGTTGADRAGFADLLTTEVGLAAGVLGAPGPPVATVFVGGGTPTLLPPEALADVLRAIDEHFGLAADAEVTVESNPDSVDERSLTELREAGFTRISFGMQSASEHVLAVLDRTHRPGRAAWAVDAARAAGFEQISVDLIYGTPGETVGDWNRSVQEALATGVGHVSAYALILERGTRLAAAVRAGRVSPTDDDLMADMYDLADEAFTAAGLPWYEISNWAQPGARCRHNIAYWHGDDWWGIGPGAHSHIGGTRWWNAKHPSAYAGRVSAGLSPAVGREVLDAPTRQLEDVMLRVRLAEGIDVSDLGAHARREAADLADAGLATLSEDRLVLTRAGRLLADAVVRRLTQ